MALTLAVPHRQLLLALRQPAALAEQQASEWQMLLMDRWLGANQPGRREEEEELLRAQALSLRRCAFLGCTNLAGPSEAALPSKRCGSCGVARYCCAADQMADWRSGGHKAACARLREAAAE